MSSVNGGSTIIVDKDGGDAVTVTDSRLDVNAAITIASESIDIGDVEVKGHAVVGHFALNVEDSGTQFPDHACKHADIMANLSNTDVIYIGVSGVGATTGIALYAGDVYSVDIENTELLYADAVVDNEDLNVVYYI